MDSRDTFVMIIIIFTFSMLSCFITCVYIHDRSEYFESNYASKVVLPQPKSRWVSDTTYYIRSTGRDTIVTVRQER